MRKIKLAGIAVALAAVLVASTLISPNTGQRAHAGPLQGSTWCAYRDTMAIIGGSSATGYLTTGYASPDGTYSSAAIYGWWKRVTDFAATNWQTVSQNYARNGASFASYMPTGQWPITRDAITALVDTKPDLLFVALGTNEYLAQLPPDTFEQNMRWVIESVKQGTPRTAIMMIVQQTAYAGPAPAYSWELYKQRIMEVAVDETLAMADIRQSVPSAYGTDWTKFYHPDRIHMLDTAQMTFAAAVRPWLFFC
jgi:acyl-CoA thioesterase-1